MNMINHDFNGGRNDRWSRICERMNRMLSNLRRYENKLGEMKLDDNEKKVRESISIIGGGIAEANILAKEGGKSYMTRIIEVLAEAKMTKDGVYSGLLRDREFSPEVMKEIHDHPLAKKARRIYDIGLSQIEKIIKQRDY